VLFRSPYGLPAKQSANVLGAVNRSQDFDTGVERPVEDENLVEACDAKQPEATQRRQAKLGIPSQIRLSREK